MNWWQGLIVFVVVTITITGCILAIIQELKKRR